MRSKSSGKKLTTMDKSKKKTIYLLLTENPDLNSHSNILWDLALNMSFQLLLRLSSSSAPPPFCGLSPTATKCSGFAPFRVFSKIKNQQAFQPFQHCQHYKKRIGLETDSFELNCISYDSFKSFSEIRTPLRAGRLRDFACCEKNSPNRFCRQQNKMKLL